MNSMQYAQSRILNPEVFVTWKRSTLQKYVSLYECVPELTTCGWGLCPSTLLKSRLFHNGNTRQIQLNFLGYPTVFSQHWSSMTSIRFEIPTNCCSHQSSCLNAHLQMEQIQCHSMLQTGIWIHSWLSLQSNGGVYLLLEFTKSRFTNRFNK